MARDCFALWVIQKWFDAHLCHCVHARCFGGHGRASPPSLHSRSRHAQSGFQGGMTKRKSIRSWYSIPSRSISSSLMLHTYSDPAYTPMRWVYSNMRGGKNPESDGFRMPGIISFHPNTCYHTIFNSMRGLGHQRPKRSPALCFRDVCLRARVAR